MAGKGAWKDYDVCGGWGRVASIDRRGWGEIIMEDQACEAILPVAVGLRPQDNWQGFRLFFYFTGCLGDIPAVDDKVSFLAKYHQHSWRATDVKLLALKEEAVECGLRH